MSAEIPTASFLEPVTNFLKGAGDKPYRKLVEYHIKRAHPERLRQAGKGEIDLLPVHLQPLSMEYIDGLNHRFANDKHFWKTASCQEAFALIIEAAMELLPIDQKITTLEDAFSPENQELAYGLFQIATLNFAYSASFQRKQRKFMGIRKGIFS